MSIDIRIAYGSKGGGLPFETQNNSNAPLIIGHLIFQPNDVKNLEHDFNKEWFKYAEIDENEDPLTASETIYDDACGWIMVSPQKLSDTDINKSTDGLVYFSIKGAKVKDINGDVYYMYMGVSGV